ncbi:hypothetical protein DFH06DRAFT_1408831 [Mycena polygramma]|nr:hypothetical protein DFH06DRAFT_1408831 [Mycena polygramma]
MLAPLVSVAVILITFLAIPTCAVPTNIYVDDTNSTVWSFDVGKWNAVTPSTPCTVCTATPDATKVVNSTWHDGTGTSGSVTFQDMPHTAGTNISFKMANSSVAGFHLYPRGSNATTYHVPFFSATNLDWSVTNTVRFSGGGVMLFDYATITVDQQATVGSASTSRSSTHTLPSPSSNHKSKMAVIAGAVLGVVGGLAILGGVLLCMRRHSRRRAYLMVEPYDPRLSVNDATSFTGAPVSSSGVLAAVANPTPRSQSKFTRGLV